MIVYFAEEQFQGFAQEYYHFIEEGYVILPKCIQCGRLVSTAEEYLSLR